MLLQRIYLSILLGRIAAGARLSESWWRARAFAYILYKLCDYTCSLVLPLNTTYQISYAELSSQTHISVRLLQFRICDTPTQTHTQTPNKSLILVAFLSLSSLTLARTIFFSFVELFVEFICAACETRWKADSKTLLIKHPITCKIYRWSYLNKSPEAFFFPLRERAWPFEWCNQENACEQHKQNHLCSAVPVWP